MAESQNNPASIPSQPMDNASDETAREGVSERGGEGGYGNDTGFATGTEAARDNDAGGSVDGGLSGREQQTANTYRDAGQGQGSLDSNTR